MDATGPCLRAEITDGKSISVADALAQKAKILDSQAFRQASVLKAIFSFVTLQAINGSLSAVKEYTIGTEVLHLPKEFEGRANNLVRVHANRLRQRLQAYYASEGAGDPVVIQVPKGSYVPRFSYRADEAEAEADDSAAQSWRRWINVAGLVLAGFLAGLAVAFMIHVSKSPAVAAVRPGSNVYRFWRPFLAKDTPAIIVLGQRKFLLTEGGAYLPFSGPQIAPTGTWLDKLKAAPEFTDRKLLEAAGRLQFADTITGLGDAEAAVLLSRTFLGLGVPASVRKSRLLRVEELRTNDIVFLGAGDGNPLLKPVLEGVAAPQIVSVERDPQTGALTRVVGRILMLPGFAQGHKTVVLTGAWTYAALAAARFCTDEKHLQELLAFPGFSPNGEFPEYFQVVVSGELVQGELSRTRLLAANAIDPGRTAAPGPK